MADQRVCLCMCVYLHHLNLITFSANVVNRHFKDFLALLLYSTTCSLSVVSVSILSMYFSCLLQHIQKFVNRTLLERSGSEMDSLTITLIWSIIVSVYPLGGFLGALIAGPMAIKLGR